MVYYIVINLKLILLHFRTKSLITNLDAQPILTLSTVNLIKYYGLGHEKRNNLFSSFLEKTLKPVTRLDRDTVDI